MTTIIKHLPDIGYSVILDEGRIRWSNILRRSIGVFYPEVFGGYQAAVDACEQAAREHNKAYQAVVSKALATV